LILHFVLAPVKLQKFCKMFWAMQSFTQSVSRGKRGKERWPEERIAQARKH
jgi:hypothetical protein